MNQASRGRRIARLTWRIARPFVLAYIVVVLFAMFMERRLVYPAPPVELGNWQPADLDHEEVWFQSADGSKLHGWFVAHSAPKRAILYCHGNGEHVALDGELAKDLRDRLHASVFVFDYRGYGRSEGTPNEAGCIADGRAARAWLVDRLGIATSDLILMGRSLGGAAAVALAADGGAKAVILENTFSSMPDVAAHTHWWLPVRLLMRNRYDSIARIEHYQGPIYQSHATEDELIPIELGRRLFSAAPSTNKKFVELVGQGHNDWPDSDYYRNLAAFLDKVEK